MSPDQKRGSDQPDRKQGQASLTQQKGWKQSVQQVTPIVEEGSEFNPRRLVSIQRSSTDPTGGHDRSELIFKFLTTPVRIPQGLAHSRGDTLSEAGIQPTLGVSTVAASAPGPQSHQQGAECFHR